MQMTNKACAEIIESSLTSWLVQSWHWNMFPSFGTLVTIETKHRTLFGIVHQIQTGSMDPSRYPFAYQKTHEELLAEQPQIFEFLKTKFSCLAIGYQEKGKIYYQCPPDPPLIHSFVSPMSPAVAKQFLYHEHYLYLLFGYAAQVSNVDELILALLKYHTELALLTPDKINAFVEHFSLLTGNDYRRLKLLLARVQLLI